MEDKNNKTKRTLCFPIQHGLATLLFSSAHESNSLSAARLCLPRFVTDKKPTDTLAILPEAILPRPEGPSGTYAVFQVIAHRSAVSSQGSPFSKPSAGSSSVLCPSTICWLLFLAFAQGFLPLPHICMVSASCVPLTKARDKANLYSGSRGVDSTC